MKTWKLLDRRREIFVMVMLLYGYETAAADHTNGSSDDNCVVRCLGSVKCIDYEDGDTDGCKRSRKLIHPDESNLQDSTSKKNGRLPIGLPAKYKRSRFCGSGQASLVEESEGLMPNLLHHLLWRISIENLAVWTVKTAGWTGEPPC